MLHWGRDGHYLKYRCPEKAGLFCCLKQHEAVSRCNTSDYGLVVILSYSSPRSHPQSPLLLPFFSIIQEAPYYWGDRKIKVELWPPKPRELLSAVAIFARRAIFGT